MTARRHSRPRFSIVGSPVERAVQSLRPPAPVVQLDPGERAKWADREFLVEWLPHIVQVIDHAFEDRILPLEAVEDFAAMRKHAGRARDALRRNGR